MVGLGLAVPTYFLMEMGINALDADPIDMGAYLGGVFGSVFAGVAGLTLAPLGLALLVTLPSVPPAPTHLDKVPGGAAAAGRGPPGDRWVLSLSHSF